MAKAPHLCFDKVLPWNVNRPHRMRVAGTGRVSAISPVGKQWVNGSKLRIRFMGGTANDRKLVKKHAPQWIDFANLDFEFTDDPTAEIRVSFDRNDGAWSYVGLDNKNIPLHAATLNLGWVDKGVILHEFGHMLGLGHEHQNPEGGIVWDEDEVIRTLAGPPNYWSPEQTRHNVLRKYAADQIHGTQFDKSSVMLYEFPGSWTHNLPEGTKGNDDLSVTDQDFVASAKMYPGRGSGGVETIELPVFEAMSGSIAQAGEEDLFTFKVERTGNFVIETSGGTDLYLSLFGPGNSTDLIAEDDDGGFGRNPRIEKVLSSGTYFARVRHYDPNATGSYEIQVVARG
ncbi:MAG: peptidase [Alphaproteobacteria bacterium]|nr:peptidase [Alphaproteobacteria bacterium]